MSTIKTPVASEIFGVEGTTTTAPRAFYTVKEGHYRLVVATAGLQFDIDRLRRDRQELVGELAVHCRIAGVDSCLAIADFNLSSARARSDRAKYLTERSKVPDLDWLSMLEDLCQRTILAERTGNPAVSLRDIKRITNDEAWEVEGLNLLPRHPCILFGDGGSAKSYLALWLAGLLAKADIKVALFDWELAPEDHRDRLERLFGSEMPEILYARCERPLVHEIDRLRRIVRDKQIEYAIFDSISFACEGPPEAAETAAAYFRATRQIGQIGSLHVAHVTKTQVGKDGKSAEELKPFGSAFWYNGARAIWNVQLTPDVERGTGSFSIGVFNRKNNLGPSKQESVGFKVQFTRESTTFSRIDLRDDFQLSKKLPIADRVAHAVRSGAMTYAEIAEQIDAEPDSISKAVRRDSRFTLMEGGNGQMRVGLVHR